MAIASDPMPSAPPLVRFEAVSKSFGGHAAVEELSLDIAAGEFFALLGPSGCGKTTLLRMLAGFEKPDRGRILLDGQDIGAVPPHRRPVNMMFQSYALFPHLSVERNIAFGLKQEGLPSSQIAARVSEMLSLVRLDGLERRRPHQLSGGQRQRVALARALVKRPKIFLLDEPLAALDRKLRMQTQQELRALQRRLCTTFLIVTHDQEEAMAMADRMGVMDRGRVVQVGSPRAIYEQPNSCWVAGFIGEVNLFEGRIEMAAPGRVCVDTPSIGLVEVAQDLPAQKGDAAFVAIRPEKVGIGAARDPGAANGVVTEIGYFGDLTRYSVTLDNAAIVRAAVANVSRAQLPPVSTGDRVSLTWAPDAPVVLLS